MSRSPQILPHKVARALVLAEPPSIGAGEITPKGSLNVRTVTPRRADLVERLYDDEDPDVIERLAAGEEVAPDSYYMRTHARLETGDARYAWVNRMLFVGTGARRASSVLVSLFAVE